MDVSNSTGQGTGYRVLGAGGVEPDVDRRRSKRFTTIDNKVFEVLSAGTLKPDTYISIKVQPDQLCVVEFTVEGQPIRHTVDWKAGAGVPEADEVLEEKPAKYEPGEILVALARNGDGIPKTFVFRKATPAA